MLFYLHNGRITEGERKGDKVCDKNPVTARPPSMNFACILNGRITEGEWKGCEKVLSTLSRYFYKVIYIYICIYIYIYKYVSVCSCR